MKTKRQTVLNYTIILQKEPEGGFTVTVPALPGCITYGEDLDEARKMAKEAIELYLESLEEDGEEIPDEKNVFYTQVQVTPSLHHA